MRKNADVLQVDVIPAGPEHEVVVRHLMELYLHDFSPMDGADVGPDGRYGYGLLDRYWIDPDRHPFLFRHDGHWVGFGLVRVGPPHDIAEFFVMRKYRRSGVGTHAARALFTAFPGEWQVRQIHANPGATTFWRGAIPVEFEDGANQFGPMQTFSIG
jgi:predicted acetyltransferase